MPVDESQTSHLLKRWHAGEAGALDELLAVHMPWLRSQVRRLLSPLLRRKGETMDYVDDVLLRLLRDIPRFHVADMACFRGLLLTIVVNELRDKHRFFTAARRNLAKERPLCSFVIELDPPLCSGTSPSQVAQRQEEEAYVRLALELMPAGQRELIVLREWQGLPFAEIAERLGVKSDAARMRYQRALHRLTGVVGSLRRGEIERLFDGSGLEDRAEEERA